MKDLVRWGPSFGYFPEPKQSWLVCDPKIEDYARRIFGQEDLAIQITYGMRYLGGHIGTEGRKAAWLRPKME